MKITIENKDGTTNVLVGSKFMSNWGVLEIPDEIKGTLELMLTECFNEGEQHGRLEMRRKIENLFNEYGSNNPSSIGYI